MTTLFHSIAKYCAVLFLCAVLLMQAGIIVRAATPTLQVTTNDSANYQIVVTGADQYSIVDLYIRSSSADAWTKYADIGTTDWNGYFIKQMNFGTVHIQESYVIVKGQQSNSVSTGSGSTTYAISFSQNNVNVEIGQSASVTVYGGSGGYYVSSNSNSNVASASVSGNTITLYGSARGSSTIIICQSNTLACGGVSVTVSGSAYGSSLYTNGQLFNYNGTIYIVYKNTITGFSNASAFLGLGYHFANVPYVGYPNMPVSGYTINTQYAAHPWGSWIKSGQTIYFVHQDGLIPIPSYDIFISSGGRDTWVVPINAYDWQRPFLSLMAYNDYRVR